MHLHAIGVWKTIETKGAVMPAAIIWRLPQLLSAN